MVGFKTFISVLLVGFSTSAQATQPAYWNCVNKLTSGSWSFGHAPGACGVSNWASTTTVRSQYSSFLFEDAKSGTAERKDYMSGMYPLVRDMGTYYIKRRNPSVTQAEINGFLQGLYSLAGQESYWTHYRNGSDSVLRYMRGDSGHGHGMMQVDDGSHSADLLAGKGVDLGENMVYGLDIYYAAWVKSATASCISSKTDYKNRARAAWSAYNGGPGSICRWSNSSSKYASFDASYLKWITNSAWAADVADTKATAAVDAKCLAEGQRPCRAPGSTPVPTPSPTPTPTPAPVPSLTLGAFYQTTAGNYCVLKSTGLDCVQQSADVACLAVREGHDLGTATKTTAATEAGYKQSVLDRHVLCPSVVTGLYAVGKTIQLAKDGAFLSAVGGTALGTIPAGTQLQIADYQVIDQATEQRYYKIAYATHEGYIYGGTKSDYGTWAVIPTNPAADPTTTIPGLAKAGDDVKIVAAAGINMRDAINGNVVTLIPVNTVVQVNSVSVSGSNNGFYYNVTYSGKTGFIYSGGLLPQNTIATWTQVTAAPVSNSLAVLNPGYAYSYLATCGASTCSDAKAYVEGGQINRKCADASCAHRGDLMTIVERNSTGWAHVTCSRGDGWIEEKYLVEFNP